MNRPRAHSFLAVAALLAAAACGRGPERAAPAREWTDPGSVSAGPWTLYYNALPATDLAPAMAEAYGVRPDRGRAVVSVSLVRDGDARAAAGATVAIEARTLIGQDRPVVVRRVQAQGIDSWLGELDVGAREELVFTVRARPADASEPLVATFRREFHAAE
jgi:hypothetical protein